MPLRGTLIKNSEITIDEMGNPSIVLVLTGDYNQLHGNRKAILAACRQEINNLLELQRVASLTIQEEEDLEPCGNQSLVNHPDTSRDEAEEPPITQTNKYELPF